MRARGATGAATAPGPGRAVRPPGSALPRFLTRLPHLSTFDRVTLVDVSSAVLDGAYAHLRQKRARYAIDPLGRLRALRAEAETLPDAEFVESLVTVFTQLRDLHTGLRLPPPWRDHVAVLPVLVERYERGPGRGSSRGQGPRGGRPGVYVVSRTARWWSGGPELASGTRITHWNGVPVEEAVRRHAARTRGANPAARLARGLESLTVRPLADAAVPDEHWVDLTFLTPDRRSLTARLPWRVVSQHEQRTWVHGEAALAALNLAVDPAGQAVQQARRSLFGRGLGGTVASTLRIMRAQVRPAGRLRVGHLRIWSFLEADHAAMLAETARILRTFEDAGCHGVVVDLRGNPGGVVQSAERLLQLFTDRPVEPVRFAFTPTALTEQLCGVDPALMPWLSSIQAAAGTGEVYSQAFPITRPADEANGFGWHTRLPAVLVVDALTYSAADLFASGWVDNDVGPIVGTAAATGAGGANVWTYRDVEQRVAQDFEPPLPPLPAGADVRVAVRRALRVGAFAGVPIEDIGVAVPEDNVHAPTRRDLLGGNDDLLAFAARRLRRRPDASSGRHEARRQ